MAPVEVNNKVGFWGPPTATLEWCEDNYDFNYYIAEFWNCVSSFTYIIPAFVGILFAIQDRLEVRFIYSYSGMILVGIASFLFHMTLKIETQMLDELSMVWTITFFVYSAYECNSPRNQRTILWRLWLSSTAHACQYLTSYSNNPSFIRGRLVWWHSLSLEEHFIVQDEWPTLAFFWSILWWCTLQLSLYGSLTITFVDISGLFEVIFLSHSLDYFSSMLGGMSSQLSPANHKRHLIFISEVLS